MPKVLGMEGRGFQKAAELGITLNCFGQYIRDDKVQFGNRGDSTKDLSSFLDRINLLSDHEVGTIIARRGDVSKGLESRQSIWKVAQGGSILEDPEPVADVSERYTLFTHRETAFKVAEALKEHDLTFRGEMHEVGNQFFGTIIMEDPKFEVPLLTLFDDYAKIGLSFQNSVDGTLVWGGQGFGVRMICCNWNMWGDLLGKVFGRHTGEVEIKFDGLLEKVFSRADRLIPINDKAWQDDIEPDKLYPIMLGAHTPPSLIQPIVSNIDRLEPLTTEHLNRYTIYQAVTAYVTRSEVDDRRGRWILKNATRYLMKTQTELEKEGNRIIDKQREKELEEEQMAKVLI